MLNTVKSETLVAGHLATCYRPRMGTTVREWRQQWLRKIIETRFGGVQARLAEKLGHDPSYITQLLSSTDVEEGKRQGGITEGAARKLEQELGLERGELDQPYPDHGNQQQRETPPLASVRGGVLDLSDRAAELEPYDLGPKRYRFPVISRVSAGPFEAAIDPYAPGAAEFWEDTDVPISQRAFGLIVRGESMVAPAGAEYSFPPGTIIVVDPAERARSGDFVVVRNNDWDDATFKQYVVDGGIKLLRPLNTAFPTIQMPPETVVSGVVVDQLYRKPVLRRRR